MSEKQVQVTILPFSILLCMSSCSLFLPCMQTYHPTCPAKYLLCPKQPAGRGGWKIRPGPWPKDAEVSCYALCPNSSELPVI